MAAKIRALKRARREAIRQFHGLRRMGFLPHHPTILPIVDQINYLDQELLYSGV